MTVRIVDRRTLLGCDIDCRFMFRFVQVFGNKLLRFYQPFLAQSHWSSVSLVFIDRLSTT